MSQDHISRDLAAPVERREVASSPYQYNGVGFPGSPDHEPYLIGNENNELQGIGGMLANNPVGSDFGDLGANVGRQGDNMRGLDVQPFVDIIPLYDTAGFDAQDGVVNDARIQELRDDAMYADQPQEPFPAISDAAHSALPYPFVRPSQASVETDE